MIFDHLKIVLGSASPRRKQLLEAMNVNFTIRISEAEEILPEQITLPEAAEYLALLKSRHIETDDRELLITADSIVVKNGILLGKPANETQARKYLSEISNAWHTVYTGVCLREGQLLQSFTDKTEVRIAGISPEEMDYYIQSGKAYDKAGAYGIQDWIGWVKVEEIRGSYANVMGLPTHRVYEALKSWKQA